MNMQQLIFRSLSLLILSCIPTTSLLIPVKVWAEKPVIKLSVGQARTKKSKIAFPSLVGLTAASKNSIDLIKIKDIIVEDLAFSGLFDFISPKAFIENPKKAGTKLGTFKMTDWTTIGAQFLIKGTGKVTGKNIEIEVHLYSTYGSKALFGKKYQSTQKSLRKLAHTVSNDIMKALTGRLGPFTSKIAFVSDKTGKKEIYIMDYDGHNIIQITSRKTLSLAPGWSPDGKKIIFTSIAKNNKNVKNHNLYEYTLATGKIRLLSNRPGINSGAAFSPSGKEIALTMSFLGNPEIFFMNPISKVAKRVTKSFGFDVDPSWSPNGQKLAFVSDRPGKPMIYTMNRDGTSAKRLTFAGRYNASPSWSPANNKIAFAGWKDGKFDIFIMNPNGTTIERLTKDMGNNEDPHFAPDGYFIVYSSNRRGGKQNLYITNIDNTIHRRITHNFGNCYNPKWGPIL